MQHRVLDRPVSGSPDDRRDDGRSGAGQPSGGCVPRVPPLPAHEHDQCHDGQDETGHSCDHRGRGREPTRDVPHPARHVVGHLGAAEGQRPDGAERRRDDQERENREQQVSGAAYPVRARWPAGRENLVLGSFHRPDGSLGLTVRPLPITHGHAYWLPAAERGTLGRALVTPALGKQEGRPRGPAFLLMVRGGVLLSHEASLAVPSALEGLTSGFGMGPGVSPSLWPPQLCGDVWPWWWPCLGNRTVDA